MVRPTIRPLRADEWARYRNLRLRALADAPDAFARTLAEDRDTPDAEWSRRVSEGVADPGSLPLVAEDAGELVGLAWGREDLRDPEVANLFQMWVAPSHRGLGTGRALIDGVVAWASERGYRALALDVTVGDGPAPRLYARAGFEPAGATEPIRPGSDVRVRPLRRELRQGVRSGRIGGVPKLRLHYFDFQHGRGEVARLALAIGGIDFEDVRIPVAEWPARREGMPLRAVPVLEVDGEAITQSNAISRYVGRLAGLHPDDPLEALRCDEVMDALEDVITSLVATFGVEDPAEMKRVREAFVEGPLTRTLRHLEGALAARGGEWFAGGALSVADLKLALVLRHLRSGLLDHIPVDLVERVAPGLAEHARRVESHPAVARLAAAG